MQNTNADTTEEQHQTDQYRFEEAAVTTAVMESGAINLQLRSAIDAADLLDAKSLKFDAREGQLLAVGLDVEVSGRSDPHARKLRNPNPEYDGAGRRVIVPPADFETAFGFTRDDVADSPVRLRVYASPDARALAFEPTESVQIDAARVEDLR